MPEHFFLYTASFLLGTGIATVVLKPPQPTPLRFVFPVVFLLLAAGGFWLEFSTDRYASQLGGQPATLGVTHVLVSIGLVAAGILTVRSFAKPAR